MAVHVESAHLITEWGLIAVRRYDSHLLSQLDQQLLTRPPFPLQRLMEEDDLLRSQLRCQRGVSVELCSIAET